MVERVDMDGSGSIEFLEFLLLMGKILQDTPSTDDLRSIFTGQHFLIYIKLLNSMDTHKLGSQVKLSIKKSSLLLLVYL